MKRAAGALALAALAWAHRAPAAPIGAGVEPVTVLALEADLEHDLAAKTLTNALRQRVLDSAEYTIGGESPPLVFVAREAKCPLKAPRGQPLDERAFDELCLKKIGRFLGVHRFFWGFVAPENGKPVARLHLWQEGQAGRSASLPYEPALRDRVAERLYRKLATPERVGDVALLGAFEGELAVDGNAAGPYAGGAELTLLGGGHDLEVREGQKVLAHARVSVEPGGRAKAQLEAVREPPPVTPWRPPNPPPVTITPRSSAWPWVLGGVAGAGLVGAGVFWGLRSGVRSDLKPGCFEGNCPSALRDDVRRGELYSTLAGVSLGVGLAAGAGLTAYLLTPRRARPVAGVVVMPTPGGAAASLAGGF